VAINPVLNHPIEALNAGLKVRWMLSWAFSNASRYNYGDDTGLSIRAGCYWAWPKPAHPSQNAF